MLLHAALCALLLALCSCSAPPSNPGQAGQGASRLAPPAARPPSDSTKKQRSPATVSVPASPAGPVAGPATWDVRQSATDRIQEGDTGRIKPLDTESSRLAVQAWEQRTCVGGLDSVTATALRGYAQGDLEAAHGWNCLARFFILLGEDEHVVLQGWKLGMEQAGLMRRELAPLTRGRSGVSLAMRLSPELRRGIPEHVECLSSFVGALTLLDHMQRVLEILSELHRTSPDDFWDYFNLALAIAVVHDVPPSSIWPHAQGPAGGFHGLGAEPAELFSYFVSQDRAGRCFQNLRALGPNELKFVVDTSVGVNQLRWARLAVHVKLDDLAKVYSSIHYRSDRARSGQMHWADGPYTLPSIAARGGICVDQALYAVEAGKACGVPTILFKGRGTSGRHAWFGFLGEGGKWHRDAGRGREQTFASGSAIDPQTWGELSEQSLAMFDLARKESSAARRARLHVEAAGCLMLTHRRDEAQAAARRALAEDPHCIGAWDFLLTLAVGVSGVKGSGTAEQEALCLEAAQALEAYPDLSYALIRRVAGSLRARAEGARADALLREFGESVRRRRSDLGLRQELDAFARELPTLQPAEQQRAFEAAVQRQAKASAIGAFDLLVVPFANYLSSIGRVEDARAAVRRAQVLLKPKAGTQLDTELRKLLAAL